MYENKKILILGAARSGIAVAKLLAKYNNDIVLSDVVEIDYKIKNELENLGIKVITGEDQISLLDDGYDLIIKNPAIMYTSKLTKKMQELNLRVENEMEVAYHFLPKNCFIIGITGSNGKTTTTTILYELLKRSEKKVVLGGNIGTPLSDLVLNVQENDILLLEISDHQLVDFNDFKTNISILTNLSEVHLDFHESYDVYKNMKKKIFSHHTLNDISILNNDNDDVMELTKDINSNKKYFSKTDLVDCYIKDSSIYYNEKIIDLDEIKVKGMHNYENIMCAIMAVKEFNVSNEVVIKVLRNFNGVEHRIEYVKQINNRQFYNDAKSTNCEATITALKSFDKSTILLLGGLDRGHSFEPLNNYMSNVKQVICYGETKDRIKDWCNSINIDCIVTETLEEATVKAYEYSKEFDVILLSPACASWDQFESFEKRGEKFKEVVDKLG